MAKLRTIVNFFRCCLKGASCSEASQSLPGISGLAFTMFLRNLLATSLASLLFVETSKADGLYTRSSSVLQVDGKNYEKLIAKSNQVSVRMIDP